MRSSAQLAALPDAAPARVGAFEIGPRIAAGGFGTVYFARRAGVHRLLAIKLAHAHLCDSPDVALMLEDEGRIASLVSHPNVARTFEAGVAEGRPYLVMELLDGEPISRVMRALSARADLEARERWGLVARTLSDAARGLHAAHIATTPEGLPLSIIHRDVAPANLVMLRAGTCQVVDFGIAKAMGRAQQTAVGVFKGHLAYASPEQVQGHALSSATDIWSLGVVGWQLAEGRPLFAGRPDADIYRAILLDPPPALDEHVPLPLRRILERALEPRPEARWPSAEALADAIDAWSTEAGIPTTSGHVARTMERLFPGAADRHALRVRAAALALGGPVLDEDHADTRLDETRARDSAVHPLTRRKQSPAALRALAPPSAPRAQPTSLGAPSAAAARAASAPSARATPRRPWRRVLVAVLGGVAVGAAAAWALPSTPVEPASELAPPAQPTSSAPGVASAPFPGAADEPPVASHEPASHEPASHESASHASVASSEAVTAGAIDREPSRDDALTAPRAWGTLSVEAVGGRARVAVRGQPECETPCQLRLPAGRHTVRLRLAGGEVRRRRIRVQPDATATLVELLDRPAPSQ